MGAPGVFIHSGILGGRLSAVPASVAAMAVLPARPPRTAPPINAPLSRKKFRRDVTASSLSTSVGSVIRDPPVRSGALRITQSGSQIFQKHACSAVKYLHFARPGQVPFLSL